MRETGKKLPMLGFGTGHLPELEYNGRTYPDQEKINEMALAAKENGVNYFDTAPLYCGGHCEKAVGEAVKGFRDEVFLAGKLQGERVKKNEQRKALEETLSRLGTDYLDYYYFWGINRYFFEDYIVKTGVLKDVFHMKEEGMVKKVAFSFHGQPEEIRWIIERAKQLGYPFSAMLVQYNLLDRRNEQMLSFAHARHMETIIMGPAAGGRLAVPSGLYRKLTGEEPATTYELALRFVMGNPDVDCTLSGMENLAMLKDNLETTRKVRAGSAEDWRKIYESVKHLKKFGELYCTGCRYCQPCPAGIRIHDIFKCYTLHNVYGLSGYAKSAYLEYIRRGGAYVRDCIGCGKCEERCPQNLSVRGELKRVDGVLREITGELYRYGEHDHGEYL